MNTLTTVLRKELRSYFLSPVALIFLGIFLVAVLFSFFTSAQFFARNIADVRPLFQWLPILLIFLVAAITMRAWSEEQKLGTLEILLTLPVRTRDLVLAKLAAGMVLVGLALALTLPLPVTVSLLGDMDWGPVIGGYLAALLLGAAYMSIGMCVSSRTDNQIVSLMVTSMICSVFLLIGSDTVAGFFGTKGSELLRAIGSGSRFRSVERGVLDVRDLLYYASICGFFLTLNHHFLEAKRQDRLTPAGRRRAALQWITVALVGLNAVALNVWLAPVTAVRADMTEDGLYSVSEGTKKILRGLKEPLHITGYFSEKTHPLLAPLVPRIRDLLTEYEIYGRGKVRLDFADPNKDEDLREEIAQLYNITSFPFRVSGRHEESVVNSYFTVLIRYGDEYETLAFGDMIEVHADKEQVDVRLRNLEYDLTRSIKKATQGFQNIESMFAQLQRPATLTVFMTPDSLPEEFKEVPERIRKVTKEMVDKSGGNLVFKEVDLSGDEAKQREVFEKYGFRPMAVDLFGEQRYYLYLLLQVGHRMERVFLQGDLTEAAIRQGIEAGIKRGTPGFLKTIGLFTEKPPPTPQQPGLPPQFQQPQQQADYRLLEKQLSEDFTVKRLELEDGVVPSEIDVLIVAKPGTLTDKQQFGVDQFLMRGGSVIALVGARNIKPERGMLRAVDADASLIEMLQTYGVSVDKSFVMDSQNARFPVPVEEQRGFFMVKRIKMMDYPFFPDIRSDGFSSDHIAMSGLQNVVMNWASPISVSKKPKGVDAEVLLKTSSKSWSSDTTQLLPKSLRADEPDFQPGDSAQKAHHVAAVLTGSFPSHYAGKPSPLFGADHDSAATADESKAEADRTGRTIKQSAPDARLAVVGSSAFASDLVAQFSNQLGGGVYRGNFQLVRNLIDWALADTDLLQIRTTGAFARTLKPIEENERTIWEMGNYGFALAALAGVVLLTAMRRRRVKPIVSGEAKA